MPEKEGAEEKTTKSVVNKKQKQMMGEEGYDHLRDQGRIRKNKKKKDATTLPVSDEVKKTQKVNKGPSALERVKADIEKKYGKGAIMNVKKKETKEELDLTQVAEAFGGYIIEAPIDAEGNITPKKGEAKKIKKKISKIEKDFIKDKKKQARAITCEIMNRSDKIELIKNKWKVEEFTTYKNIKIKNFFGGKILNWKIRE